METKRQHLDLTGHQLRNARIHPLANAPSSPVAGQVYFDTDDSTFYGWTGSEWASMSGGGEPIVGTLQQSTAYTRLFYLGSAGLSPTVEISKAGGAFASPAGTLTEVSDGWYKLALTAADTDTLGDLVYNFVFGGLRLAPSWPSLRIQSAILPLDLQTARDGSWVQVTGTEHLTILFHKANGSSGDDPTVRLQQAQNSSGTGAKDLNYTEYWIKQGTLSALTNAFTRNTQSAAATTSFNGVSAEQQILFALEIDPSMMDVAGAFDHVRLRVDDVGSSGEQLASALYIVNNLALANYIRSDFRDKVVA